MLFGNGEGAGRAAAVGAVAPAFAGGVAGRGAAAAPAGRGGAGLAQPVGNRPVKYGSSMVTLHNFQAPFSSTAWLFGYMPPSRLPPVAEGSGWNSLEEHTSELQSRENLVCRLLLEKKKE